MTENSDIIKAVSKEKNNLQNMLKSIRNIEKLAQDPLGNLHKIKQDVVKIEKALKQSSLGEFTKEGVRDHIQPTKSKIPEWDEQFKRSFGQKLEDALRQEGFELRGHYPLLKVLFYTLEVRLENNNVILWYGPQQEKIETCKLIPEIVVQKLKKNHDKITQRNFEDKLFFSNLYEAYRMAVYKNEKTIGGSLPISKVLQWHAFLIQDKKFKTNPTKKSYKEYGRVFFSYDLYRLKERRIENHELSLITATRAYTKQRSNFLWIPSNEKGDGNYISHIKFREV